MTVTLRERKKGGRISLYLDYYSNGKRTYEYLQLYLYPQPENARLTREQRKHNQDSLALAKSICAKRQVEIKNNEFGFADTQKLEGSFLVYVDSLAEARKESLGNYGSWDSALKHLKKFTKGRDITFKQVDARWLRQFREYLQKEARTPANAPLSQNSQCSYFNKIRAAIRQAVKEGIMQKNPVDQVESIRQGDPQREFLTHEELQRMANADCDMPILKTAFLFSALTGLRWSDVQKLTWAEVQHSREMGNYIRFRQKKTKGAETLPISEDALSLLGKRGKPDDRVFVGLKYSSWHNLKIQQWAMRAGISKTVSFHVGRHTYATLQLTLGTDIYTVSKLLGHKDLKTTQIYAKVIDEKKKEAANKIKLFLNSQ